MMTMIPLVAPIWQWTLSLHHSMQALEKTQSLAGKYETSKDRRHSWSASDSRAVAMRACRSDPGRHLRVAVPEVWLIAKKLQRVGLIYHETCAQPLKLAPENPRRT